MATGPRAGMLALFFVGGMAFMAALFAMIPRDFLSRDAARVITASSPPGAYSTAPALPEADAPPPAAVPTLPLLPPEPGPADTNRFPGEVATDASVPPTPTLPKENPVLNANSRPEPPLPEPPAVDGPKSGRPRRSQIRTAGAPEALGRAEVVRRLKPGRRILGRVVLDGDPPPEKVIVLDHVSAAAFKTPPTTRFFVVGSDGALADVVVAITAGLPRREWPVVNKPWVISNRRSFIEPYISAAQAGQPIVFENLDFWMHSIHIAGRKGSNPERIFALAPKSEPVTVQFPSSEEFLKVGCDIHPWEIGYISLFDHPYFAVTGLDGRFELDGLPLGRYTLSAAHRKAGTVRKEIEVREDSSLELEIVLSVVETMADNRK